MKNNVVLNHLAIIMDGNGRWAKCRGLERLEGHKKGVKAMEKTIFAAQKYGIKFISLFAFSTENWQRDEKEVNGIFELAYNFLEQNMQNYKDKNIKVVCMGEISRLPEKLRTKVQEVIAKTKDNTSITVNLALNYGSKQEIVRACNALVDENKRNITEQDIKNKLYTANMPDVDFVIRTSGEQRLSNFMLFQSAYSELYFPKFNFPDFNERKLKKCIKVYQNRNRTFGKIPKEKK